MSNNISTETFLQILEPESKSHNFQVFDDTLKNLTPAQIEARRVNCRAFNGPWEKHKQYLHYLNHRRYGVSVAVNRAVGGRNRDSVTHIRAVFYDDDQGIDPKTLPLPPSIIVSSSPGLHHFYWLLDTPKAVDEVARREFAAIIKAMIALGSDKNAKDLSRVLRLPGTYNTKRDQPHLVTADLNTDFLDRPLRYPWERLKQVFRPPNQYTEPAPASDIIDILNPKNTVLKPPFQTALVASALSHCDPGCEYNRWLQLGMAIHHASNGDEQGYRIFRDWSRGSALYSESDWPDKWRTFEDPQDGRAVGIGTLLKWARLSGWNYQYDYNLPGIEDFVRLEIENQLEHMNEYFGLIPVMQKLCVIHTIINEHGQLKYGLMSESAAKTYFAPRKVPKINDKKEIIEKTPVYNLWVNWEKRREFIGFKFQPDVNIEVNWVNPKRLKDEKYYNTYFGLLNSNAPGDCQRILDHIKRVWAKGHQERYEYIINWLAHMYQHPGQPAETIIVLRSMPGAGKNIIADEILKSFGTHGRSDPDGSAVTQRFNGILSEAIFILVGEAFFKRDESTRSKLDHYATQEFLPVELKGQEIRDVKNCLHIMCLSNEDVPMALKIGDRRVFVLQCSNELRGDFLYFEKLKNYMDTGGMSAFIEYLKSKKLGDFHPRKMPEMERGVKSDMITQDPKFIMSFLRQALMEEDFQFTSQIDEPLNSEIIISVDLYRSYQQYCYSKTSDEKSAANAVWFGRKLSEIFPDSCFKKVRLARNNKGKRPVAYKWNSFRELKAAYDLYLGAPVDWGDEEEDQITQAEHVNIADKKITEFLLS